MSLSAGGGSSSEASSGEGGAPSGGGAGGALADAGAECSPPYDCETGGGGAAIGDKDAATPEGDGGTPVGPEAPCREFSIPLATGSLFATGPTPELVAAYDDTLMHAPGGPVAFVLLGMDSLADADRSVGAQGVTSEDGYFLSPTEPLADFAATLSPDRTLTIARTANPFHLAFTTLYEPAGDIAVSELELTGTLEPGCTFVSSASVTLYLSELEAGDAFHGSTLAALLGPKNADIGGGTANGWAITLAGSLTEAAFP